jgi:hypothetical protein
VAEQPQEEQEGLVAVEVTGAAVAEDVRIHYEKRYSVKLHLLR